MRADLPFVRADVTSSADVDAVCAGQDAVVHTVALVRGREERSPSDFVDVMVKGTWHAAEACLRQGVGRLVNVSSIVSIGSPRDRDWAYQVDDPSQFRAADLYYCLSKSLGEQVGLAFHQAQGLSVIHIRPGVIAGDGVNQGPKAPEQPSGPWFMYVDPRDVAQAVELAIESDLAYGTFQIVAGREDSLYDWKDAAQRLRYRPEHNWQEIPDAGGDE